MRSIMHPESLSAKFKNSFAYTTVKDRLPNILAKIVDTTFRQRHEIKSTLGEKGCEDLKLITGALSELRYRISTDKPLTPIVGQRNDVSTWNKCLQNYEEVHKFTPSWFKSPWLLVECYMYRKIVESLETSDVLKNFDPFQYQKHQALVGALPAINILAEHILDQISNDNGRNLTEKIKNETFLHLLQTSLWGNKCDLSISGGEQSHHVDPMEQVDELKKNILINDSNLIYESLIKSSNKKRVDIVLDNAGLEFFGDLCLGEFLVSANFVEKVVFHVKTIPWFVSDTTVQDFTWTLEMLNGSQTKNLKELGCRWYKRQEDGSFSMKVHDFWTLPHPFSDMQAVAPDLYDELKSSDLVIFKGDLNYRKLIGDLNWPPTTTFVESLRQFSPAPLVALRTMKADVIVGLAPGVAEKMTETDEKWMISGDYAVIQFYKPE